MTGDLVATIPVTRRFDLTDAQWAVLQPLLPKGKKPGRPPKWSKRQLIDGIRWRVRVGSPWRDVARRAGLLRVLADGVRTVPTLAAQRDLAADRDQSAGPRRRRWTDHLGRQRGLHDQPGTSARRRCPQPAAERTARRGAGRTGRPRVGTLTRRVDHEAAP